MTLRKTPRTKPFIKASRRGAVSVGKKRNYKTVIVVLLKRLVMLSLFSTLVFAGFYYKDNVRNMFELRPVENILVESSFENLSRAKAMEVIAGEIKDHFLQVDLDELRNILEGQPWIEKAVVARQWPNALAVKLVEQTPIARWGEKGFLNQRGEIVYAEQNEGLMSLPWLYGDDGSSAKVMNQYQDLSLLLRSRDLLVGSLWLDSKNAWRMTLRNGVKIVLGKDDVLLKMQRFINIYDQYLAVNMNAVDSIDLRYVNGLAVGWSRAYKVELEGTG